MQSVQTGSVTRPNAPQYMAAVPMQGRISEIKNLLGRHFLNLRVFFEKVSGNCLRNIETFVVSALKCPGSYRRLCAEWPGSSDVTISKPCLSVLTEGSRRSMTRNFRAFMFNI